MTAAMWPIGYWLGETGTPEVPSMTIADNGDGTGAVATISGTLTNSINTVYTQLVESIWSPPLWQTSASRVGDGTIELTLAPGHYLGYCLAEIDGGTVCGTTIYFTATAGTQSVKTRILVAVQTRLQSLNLSGIALASIIVKKLPIARYLAPTGTIAMPAAIIADVAAEDMPAKGTCQLDDVDYPIQVTLAEVDNQESTVEANHPQHALWRQQIERAFRFQRLPGVPEIINCLVQPSAPIDQQAWAKNYYASALTLRFTSRETRGA